MASISMPEGLEGGGGADLIPTQPLGWVMAGDAYTRSPPPPRPPSGRPDPDALRAILYHPQGPGPQATAPEWLTPTPHGIQSSPPTEYAWGGG